MSGKARISGILFSSPAARARCHIKRAPSPRSIRGPWAESPDRTAVGNSAEHLLGAQHRGMPAETAHARNRVALPERGGIPAVGFSDVALDDGRQERRWSPARSRRPMFRLGSRRSNSAGFRTMTGTVPLNDEARDCKAGVRIGK
jgi:hypothetical protein